MKLFNLLLVCAMVFPALAQDNNVTLEDGTKLYLVEKGQGKTILFIPGWTMTHGFFKNQQNHFSENYHVLTYDPRGQGRSDKTTQKNTYAHHALDLREMMLQKELDEIVLIGWSSGCLTIYEYLKAYDTDRISKLIFIDEPPKWIGDEEKEWVYGSFDDYRGSLKAMISKPSDPSGIIEWMLNDPIDDETAMWMRDEILMTPPYVALSLYVDGLACDYNEVVGRISIPALFMVRESWFDQASRWLEVNAPGARVTSIKSHAMFWERPQEFNEMLEEFIQSK